MKFLLVIALPMMFLGACKKDDPILKQFVYSASFTINSAGCPDDFGFRAKGSSDALSPTFQIIRSQDGVDLEFVVVLCNSISSNNLPSTIPAVIYRDGEVFLVVNLIRSSVLNRTYFYYFKHF